VLQISKLSKGGTFKLSKEDVYMYTEEDVMLKTKQDFTYSLVQRSEEFIGKY
jgi:hypothetical protein